MQENSDLLKVGQMEKAKPRAQRLVLLLVLHSLQQLSLVWEPPVYLKEKEKKKKKKMKWIFRKIEWLL